MITLQEKFRGCIAATWIGSAMGAAVEGWTGERITETYGFLDQLLPYQHYRSYTDWERPPGTTEDGIERQKLIATAIIEKNDRILAQDLIRVWLRVLNPDLMLYKQERFDRSLLELAQAGVPPSELGRLWPYPNINSIARASHPVGLINAGDPEGAADDTYEIAQVYLKKTHFGARWAALYNAALAHACTPDATVESVLDVARRFVNYRAEGGSLYALYDSIEQELDRALDLADTYPTWEALRNAFNDIYYGGKHITYGMSQANEVVCKGLAIFSLTQGDPRKAILASVNFGRDTDCLAAVAGGLAGALYGTTSLPDEWIDQVNEATEQDPYSNDHRTIEETADALLGAYRRRHERLVAYTEFMEQSGFLS